jgi:broad specificity phosphatase PhoE
MRLYLIRHGQTVWNADQRAQGHSDIPLDATGLAQAQCLGPRFEGRKIDLVLSSDLQRAKQTAEPIVAATKAKWEQLPELRERGFGEWEGQPFLDIALRWPGLEAEEGIDRLHIRPPGGESFTDVWDRLESVAGRLLEESRNTVVVSHGGACALLLARLIHGTVETSRAFRFANCSVTKLERRPEGHLLISTYNDVRHLMDGPILMGSVDGASR